MKSILTITRNLFITAGVLLFLILTFVVKSDGVTGTQDLLGLAIPQPPQFTTFIPYFGYVIGVFFEMFSLHGIVTILLPLALVSIGMKIDKYIEEEQIEKQTPKYREKPALELQKEIEEQQNKSLSQEGKNALLKHLKDIGSIKE